MLTPNELLSLLTLMLGFPGQRARLAQGLMQAGLAAVAAQPEWRAPERARGLAAHVAHVIRRMGLTVVPVWGLPERILRARPPPPALLVRGDAALLQREGVGIVGARRASRDAELWAHAVAGQLARAGELVVSGGARGIDAAAHRGALEARAPTLVFIGVAADRVYPALHRDLFARVLTRGGAVVSEHLPGAPTFSWAHAARNRFIAAVSRGVLVVEADLGSGSLGTAEEARRMGVPVWVSPRHVGRRRAGVNNLLAAGLARCWGDP